MSHFDLDSCVQCCIVHNVIYLYTYVFCLLGRHPSM